jgi:hypothetical protein
VVEFICDALSTPKTYMNKRSLFVFHVCIGSCFFLHVIVVGTDISPHGRGEILHAGVQHK